MEVRQEHHAAARGAAPRSVFKKHPRLALIAVLSVLFFALILGAETALRFLVGYRIDYYTFVTTSNSTQKYPYGKLHINSYGFPDVEWDLTDPRPRVGVVGDSVTLG